MEKRKLLLVAVSVGVFLVIVIGAAILVFTPRSPAPVQSARTVRPIPAGTAGSLNSGSASSSGFGGPGPGNAQGTAPFEHIQTQPASVDPSEMVRNSGGYQGLQVPPSAPAAAIQENNFYINGDIPNQPVVVENGKGDTSTVVINVPRPITAAVPDAAPSGRSSSPTAHRQAAQKPAPVPAAAKPPAAVAAVKPPVQQAPAAKPPAQTQGKPYDTYWVQTGSFSTKVRADSAKERLTAKGITAIIENREVDAKTYYRVRVGPYTSSSEADYWLSIIKSIQGFEESQVWKNPVKR
ncbi:MAG: SPOR domain-containing protein [Treponema sp.]|jgi:DedD protein|nr:SPOR domain-containing protein [Treponema sp.]